MNCHRIFDLAETGFKAWPALLVGAGIVLVGLVIAYFASSGGFAKRWSVVIFGVIWTAAIIASTLWPYVSLRRALLAGTYQRIEGPITEYRPLGARNTGNEMFVVEGRRFEFSEYDLAPGFKLTRRRGGTLDVGTYVRIAHIDNTILFLDVCTPQ